MKFLSIKVIIIYNFHLFIYLGFNDEYQYKFK